MAGWMLGSGCAQHLVVLRRRILCKPYFEYVRDYVCSQALSSLSPGPASVIFLPMQNFLTGILCCSGIFSRPYGNSPFLTIRLQGCCVISPVRWHVSSPVPPLNADVPQHTSLSFCITCIDPFYCGAPPPCIFPG